MKIKFFKRALHVIPLFLLILIFFVISGSCGSASSAMPKANKGIIDLSSWNFSSVAPVVLDGEWNFFPGSFVFPSSINENIPPIAHNIMIPDSGIWNTVTYNDTKLSPYGFATYRLKINLGEIEQDLALFIPEMFSASRVYFNGNLIHEAGKVGSTAQEAESAYIPEVVRVATKIGENELIVQISNFTERRGGFNRSFLLGGAHAVQMSYVSSLAMDLVIYGSLLTIGLYHLCLFWLRKKDRSPLWFGIFCLFIGIRTILYGERFAYLFFSSVPWWVFNRLDHLSFYLGIPIFAAYVVTIFERDISHRAMQIYMILGLFFACMLFFPPVVFNTTVVVYEVITLFYVVYLLVVIVRAFIRKREGALTTMVGILLFLCFGINEILFNMGIINTFNSLSIGLVIFLFTQSILIAMRFSKAFDESEHLGETLLSMNNSLRRFIPAEFFRLLHRAEVNEIKLGDQVEQSMTIMFSDIRRFTSLAEQLGAANTFGFLNDYFSRVGEVIRSNNGFIDKYMGDGFIALFPHSPDDALRAAIGIQRVVTEFNTSREGGETEPIDVGIGLNYGPLILGTVGDEHRMDTTVIADSVNLCSRLEGLCKMYGKGTIVPFDFLDRLENPDDYHWRYLGLIRVQGRVKPVEVVHVYDGLSEAVFQSFHDRKSRFEDALHSYRNGEYEIAMKMFRDLASEHPDDPAYFTFITQIHRLIASGMSEDWDGIESLPAK